jgi:hypothetical protein
MMSAQPPNNGMHPTANQRVSHRELAAIGVVPAAGDAERWAEQVRGFGV